MTQKISAQQITPPFPKNSKTFPQKIHYFKEKKQ